MCSRSASSPPPSEATISPAASRSFPPRPVKMPQPISTMPSRITSSLSGKLPQGASGRSSIPGLPARLRGRAAVPAEARARRAASRSARVVGELWVARLRLRLPTGARLPARCQVANGHAEETPAGLDVPVLAAALADVLVGDPNPLVMLRLEQHLLDQAAVLLLHVGSVGEHSAGLLHPGRQVVAQFLELDQAEHPGPAPRAHVPLEALARPGGAEELCQLLLEPRDLVQQGAPGRTLVGNGPRLYRRTNARRIRRLGVRKDLWHVPSGARLRPRLYQRAGRVSPAHSPSRSTSVAVQSASSRLIWGTPLTRRAASTMRSLSGATPASSAISPKSTASERRSSATTICRTDSSWPLEPSRS